MNVPSISVIIPNYNHAPYLKQRIESVLDQTYQDFEIIILDDNSTDNSKEIIDQYANYEKVSNIVFNEINSGSPFKQWQKGIRLANGKYIWIAESDDYADNELLSTLMKPFSAYNDLIISYCQSQIVDDQGKFISLSSWADPLNKKKWKNDYIESASTELNKYLSFRNTIPNASAVVFTNPNNVNLLDESCEFKMMGDWVFWRKLLSKPGRIAYCATPHNYFRLHENTTRSVASKEKELAKLKEYELLIMPSQINPFKNNYDWIIISWWNSRVLYKGTKYYYLPNFPFLLMVRVFLVVFKLGIIKLLGHMGIEFKREF